MRNASDFFSRQWMSSFLRLFALKTKKRHTAEGKDYVIHKLHWTHRWSPAAEERGRKKSRRPLVRRRARTPRPPPPPDRWALFLHPIPAGGARFLLRKTNASRPPHRDPGWRQVTREAGAGGGAHAGLIWRRHCAASSMQEREVTRGSLRHFCVTSGV